MNSLHDLTVVQLRRAAELKDQIDNLNNELAAILGGAKVSAPVAKGAGRGRGMTAAGKASQAEKMRAYWAAKRAAKGGTSAAGSATGGKKRRTMSPEAKAKIAAAARARWAKIRAMRPKK